MSRTSAIAGRICVLALVGVSLGACATKRDFLVLHSEVRALAARQDSVYEALIRAMEQANRATQDSLAVVSDLLFDFRGDVSNRLLAIQDQQLRHGELVGQSQRSLAGMREELISQRQRLDEQLAVREEEGDSVAAGGSEEEGAVLSGTGEASEEAYNSAVRQLNRGNLNVARRAFEGFLEQYPNSDLAPSAYVHLGELLSHDDNLDQAIETYLKVPELFPAADQVPDALYRAGLLCIELEDFDRARQFLERLVNTYPDHRHAEPARERLQDIP